MMWVHLALLRYSLHHLAPTRERSNLRLPLRTKTKTNLSDTLATVARNLAIATWLKIERILANRRPKSRSKLTCLMRRVCCVALLFVLPRRRRRRPSPSLGHRHRLWLSVQI